MNNPMNEMWRAQQDAATRVTEGWLGLLQPGAQTATPPTPDDRTPASTGDTGAEDTRAEEARPEDTAAEDASADDASADDTAAEDFGTEDIGGEEVTEQATEQTVDSDDPPEVAGPESAALEAIQAIRAIQNLGDGQRDFAEHMIRWAELQRDLADSVTAWATQQREYADAVDRLLAPFSGPVTKT